MTLIRARGAMKLILQNREIQAARVLAINFNYGFYPQNETA